MNLLPHLPSAGNKEWELWPRMWQIEQDDIELFLILLPLPQFLGLQVCATMPGILKC